MDDDLQTPGDEDIKKCYKISYSFFLSVPKFLDFVGMGLAGNIP